MYHERLSQMARQRGSKAKLACVQHHAEKSAQVSGPTSRSSSNARLRTEPTGERVDDSIMPALRSQILTERSLEPEQKPGAVLCTASKQRSQDETVEAQSRGQKVLTSALNDLVTLPALFTTAASPGTATSPRRNRPLKHFGDPPDAMRLQAGSKPMQRTASAWPCNRSVDARPP